MVFYLQFLEALKSTLPSVSDEDSESSHVCTVPFYVTHGTLKITDDICVKSFGSANQMTLYKIILFM